VRSGGISVSTAEEIDTLDEEKDYDDEPLPPDPTTVAKVRQEFNENGTIRKCIKARKSAFVHNLIYLDGAKFSFLGREYLLPIYDRKDSRILLKTSRQVEKCCHVNSTVVLASGLEKRASELVPGDRIVAAGEGWHQAVDTVIVSETNGDKPCVRIKTRLGSTLEVTLNHPLKKLTTWIDAGQLKKGDKLAALRSVGHFGKISEPLAPLLGLMIGDGAMTESCCRFTCKDPTIQAWFEQLYGPINFHVDNRSGTRNYYVGINSPVIAYVKQHGLFGKVAYQKELPPICFSYTKESTRELLRGLWATDGHCKNVTKSKIDLVYCTTSPILARQVRMLLRKFGVVTVQRENRPSNGGRLAYIIRVVTRRSIEAFHRELGPIPGKPFELPTCKAKSNLDTLPQEVHGLILKARKDNGSHWTRDSLGKLGLIQHMEYCPTYEKVSELQKVARSEEVQRVLDSDIIWDEVVSVEDIGVQPTWALQTGTETFLSDFVVNHNTTSLANHLVVRSVVKPYNKSLYVSPSHTQTRQFSSEKLKPAIERSPFIMRYLQDSQVSSQVFEKGFTNGSFIFLRSAFRSADRARGISARDLCYDKDAYALTRLGWKKISDIVEGDELADVNDSGLVEWNKPTRIISKKHTGRMISFEHGGFHLRVTDDHSLWVNFKVKAKSYKEDRYEFSKASALLEDRSMGFKMTCSASWPLSNEPRTIINGVDLLTKEFNALLGWYLAEGCMSSGYPVLNLHEKDLTYIEPLLKSMGLRYNIYPNAHNKSGPGKTLWVMSKPLGSYFKRLGKSYTKFIPRDVLDAGLYLDELLKGLFLGDACYHKGERWQHGTLRTRSKQLAEDAQEAWLRLGKPAALHTRMHPNKARNLNPDEPFELVPMYEVCAYDLDYIIFWRSQRDARIIPEEVVEEDVFCFTIKNHRPIVKGNHSSKPVISGNCIDEIQDFYTSEIPVIRECTSHFPDSTEIMAGTPKSHDNPIEIYWGETTQNEWLVPCSCGKWNFLDEQNIAPTEMYTSGKLPPGPVCKKCMKPINVRAGKWMSTSPGKSIQGYRIPQLMVPWIVGTLSQWLKLTWKRDNYPFGQFYNEVLGLSYDSASKPVTRDELIACCSDYDLWNPEAMTQQQLAEARGSVLTAGVDWGEGIDGSEKSPSGKVRNASYTVLTIGTYINQRQWAVKLVKKYMGKEIEPDHVVADICRIVGGLNVAITGVDWGHGWGVNNSLVRKLGPSRVVQYQYLPKLKQRMKWDPLGYRYHLQRNFMLSELFYDLKHGHVMFPRWAQIEPYAKDILSVYAEYSEYRREIKYDHRPSDPDDWLHSLHYAKLTSDIHLGKSRRYTLPE
jgi:intein/homing endonuclease